MQTTACILPNLKKQKKSQVGFGTWFWFYSLSESNLKPMKGLRGARLVCDSRPATPSTEAGCSPTCVSPVKILCSHVPWAVSVCTLPSVARLNQHSFVFTPLLLLHWTQWDWQSPFPLPSSLLFFLLREKQPILLACRMREWGAGGVCA